MKKYIISYLPSEYVIKGIFIPKKGYNQEELALGKREIVAVTEQQVNLLMTSALFQTFIETKKMRILDKAPEGLLSGEERMARLVQENKDLKAALADNKPVKAGKKNAKAEEPPAEDIPPVVTDDTGDAPATGDEAKGTEE